MKECLVVGKVGTGKTLFVLNFASYLGLNQADLTFEFPDNRTITKRYYINTARSQLVGTKPHTTKSLQSLVIEIPVTKGVQRCRITDTSGLIDYIHPDITIRQAIAQTLSVIRAADLIMHVMDTAQVGVHGTTSGLGEVDYQVALFAQMRGGYVILANKMDLPQAGKGLERLRLELPGHRILPISALNKRGFREVKDFVQHHL